MHYLVLKLVPVGIMGGHAVSIVAAILGFESLLMVSAAFEQLCVFAELLKSATPIR